MLTVLFGCGGSGLERVPVSGKVTFNGQPVPDGQIRFVPLEGTAGPASIEVIRNGVYAFDAKGGVPAGSHRVEIRSYDPNTPQPTAPGMRPRKQLIPVKYNTQSELEITLEKGQGSVTKNFDLSGEGGGTDRRRPISHRGPR